MIQLPTPASLAALLVLAVLGWGYSESHAVTYTYAGTCTANCDRVSLSPRGAVSGSISFGDAALVAGSVYPAPLAFSLDFGTVHITQATATHLGLFATPEPPPPGLLSPAIVPTDLTTFAVDLRAGEDPVPPATGADFVSAAPGLWFAHPNATCITSDCNIEEARGFPATGSGAWSIAASIPEPSAVSLVTTGLLGATWLVRKRRTC